MTNEENETPTLSASQLVDDYTTAPVIASETVFEGHVWNVVSQEADLGNAGHVTREFVDHPGAVAVLALRGAPGEEEALVIQQYRHPIGAREWEIPAGLRDVDGEPPHEAARRELYEEADLRAREMSVLIDYASSPGGLSEQLRIFVTRDAEPVEQSDRFEREEEERDMPTAWVKLEDIVTAAMAGRIHNPTLLMGTFAAVTARAHDWQGLRPADAPWLVHASQRV